MKALIFDTETTDINGYAIEISLIIANLDETTKEFEPISYFATAVNPTVPVNPRVKKIFGIDENALQEFPTFKELWKGKLEELFKTADIIVAHNIPFDLTVLQRELNRYQIGNLKASPKDYTERNCFCTCNDTVSLFRKKLKLQELGRKLYVSRQETKSLLEKILENTNYNPSSIRTKVTGFHTAVYDTAYTYLSFARLYRRYKRFERLMLKRKENPKIL